MQRDEMHAAADPSLVHFLYEPVPADMHAVIELDDVEMPGVNVSPGRFRRENKGQIG
jgi:hypothetical protein